MAVRFAHSPKLRADILAGNEPAWLQRHPRRSYIVRSCLCTPPWVRRSDFAALVQERNFRTAATGVPHVLDHIIPLSHPLVWGLNVPWNIQVIDTYLNARKSNNLHAALQLALFSDPEQLALIL